VEHLKTLLSRHATGQVIKNFVPPVVPLKPKKAESGTGYFPKEKQPKKMKL